MLTPLLLCALQTTWIVDAGAPPGGDGSAAHPYDSIQAAHDAAATTHGDTIAVAPGVYTESLDLGPKGVTIEALDPATPPRLWSDVPGEDTIRITGPTPVPVTVRGFEVDAAELAARVLVVDGAQAIISDCDFDARLVEPCSSFWCEEDGEGLLVRGASLAHFDSVRIANFDFNMTDGAGLRIESGTVVIRDSLIEGNGENPSDTTGEQLDGGGVFVSDGANVAIEATVIRDNRARNGSGIASRSSHLQIIDSVIEANGSVWLSVEGGGLHGRGEITGSTISSNRAWLGGGLHGSFTVHGCDIVGNTGSDGSALAPASFGPVAFTNCSIRGHSAADIWSDPIGVVHGAELRDCVVRDNAVAAIYSSDVGAVTACTCYDTLIVDNRGEASSGHAEGGGAFLSQLVRCTLAGNRLTGSSISSGGAASSCLLVECIVRDNEADDGSALHDCVADRCVIVSNTAAPGGSAVLDSTVTNSVIWSNAPDTVTGGSMDWSCAGISPADAAALGTGNITADPRLWDLAAGDYRLTAGSPCIDAGDPARFDPDGSRLDIGLVPFDPADVPPPSTYCAAKTDANGCTPSISTTTAPSVTGANWAVRVDDVVGGQFGVFFVGTDEASAPHFGGTLCVGGALTRSVPTATGGTAGACDGSLLLIVPPQRWVEWGYSAGDTVVLQAFYRAAPGPLPDALGLSDAIEATLLP